MDTRLEIIEQMQSFAPGKFEDWQIDYIKEAMQRYADFCLNEKENDKSCQED